MKVKTNIKADGLNRNHNETLVRNAAKAGGLKVKTSVKAGAEAMSRGSGCKRCATWPGLTRLAEQASTSGRKVSPMQVAAQILEDALARMRS
jgi:hypothetical protein